MGDPFIPLQPGEHPESREAYRDMFGATMGDWLVYHQRRIVFNQCHWMGYRMLKTPMDAWVYQEMLVEIQPDIMLEIGSAHGGSTMFFASLLDLIGKGQVISLDIDRDTYQAKHPRIIDVTGDSRAPEIVQQVKDLCEGKSVMAIHDGDHRKPSVLADLENYASLVSIGSYFIVEDGIVDLFEPHEQFDQFQEDGPFRAAEEFLSNHPEFQADKSRERYLMTYAPHGFLKRVR